NDASVPNTPERIEFGWTPVPGGGSKIVKRAGGTTDSSGNVRGTCALQKLTTTLFGINEPMMEGGNALPVLQPGAQYAAVAPKLICAAESAHGASPGIVRWGAGAATPYGPGTEVPSCAACQAMVPSVISGSYRGQCTAAQATAEYPTL